MASDNPCGECVAGSDVTFQCHVCYLCFQTYSMLTKHRQKEHGVKLQLDGTLTDGCTNKSFTSSLLTETLRPKKCPLCGILFKLKSTLKYHLHCYHHVKSCIEMRTTFEQTSSSLANSDQFYKCHLCRVHFKGISRFNIHLNVYHNVKSCQDERLSPELSCTSITSNPPYKCDLCNVNFRLITPYKEHIDMYAAVKCALNDTPSEDTPAVIDKPGPLLTKQSDTDRELHLDSKQIQTSTVEHISTPTHGKTRILHGHISTRELQTNVRSLYICPMCSEAFHQKRVFLDHKCSRNLQSLANLEESSDQYNQDQQSAGGSAVNSVAVAKRPYPPTVKLLRNIRPKLATDTDADPDFSSILNTIFTLPAGTAVSSTDVLVLVPGNNTKSLVGNSPEAAESTAHLPGGLSNVSGNMTVIPISSATPKTISANSLAAVTANTNKVHYGQNSCPANTTNIARSVTPYAENTLCTSTELVYTTADTGTQDNPSVATTLRPCTISDNISQCEKPSSVQTYSCARCSLTFDTHVDLIKHHCIPTASFVKRKTKITREYPLYNKDFCDGSSLEDSACILDAVSAAPADLAAKHAPRSVPRTSMSDTLSDETSTCEKPICIQTYLNCARCHNKFDTRMAFVKHHSDCSRIPPSTELFSTKAKAKPTRVKCPLCNKDYYDKATLNNHIKIHTGQKAYVCSICNKRFGKPRSLKRHMLSSPKHKCGCDKTSGVLCDWCKAFKEKVEVDVTCIEPLQARPEDSINSILAAVQEEVTAADNPVSLCLEQDVV